MFEQLYKKNENGEFEAVAAYISPLYPGVYYVKKEPNVTSIFKIFGTYENFNIDDLKTKLLEKDLIKIISNTIYEIYQSGKPISIYDEATLISEKLINSLYTVDNDWELTNNNYYVYSKNENFTLEIDPENKTCTLSELPTIKINFNFENLNFAFKLSSILINLLQYLKGDKNGKMDKENS